MSAESLEWLNRNIIVGYTEEQGAAWWNVPELANGFENHYPRAIPVERLDDLFGFEFVERDIYVVRSDGSVANARHVADRKAIVHPTTGEVTGIFKLGYQMRQFRELVENIAAITDTAVGTGLASMGLLRSSAVGFASVRAEELIHTPEGVDFFPWLFGADSVDGSLATTYGQAVTLPVCDNTLGSGMQQAANSGRIYKVKHTRYSGVRLADARAALQVLIATADEFSAQVAALCRVKVSDADFRRLLDVQVPVSVDMTDRSRSFATAKRGDLNQLYRHDQRCAPWQGTAFGVLQTWNTYNAHEGIVRDRSGGTGGGRIERNYLAGITGKTQAADASVMADLGAVLGVDLAAIA